jgi:hypothetical protein
MQGGALVNIGCLIRFFLIDEVKCFPTARPLGYFNSLAVCYFNSLAVCYFNSLAVCYFNSLAVCYFNYVILIMGLPLLKFSLPPVGNEKKIKIF